MADQSINPEQQHHEQDADMEEQQRQQAAAPVPTSLRYLRLKNDFRSMLKSGMDCIDEQEFIQHFKDLAEPHLLKSVWQLLKKQREAIVDVATEEMELACREVGLQQQLEELEGLVLQRGLVDTSTGNTDPADASKLPAAAEAATRVAAKQAEKQRLQQALQELVKQQAALQTQLDAKQQQANDLLSDFAAVEQQVDQVYKASRQWMVQPAEVATAD